LRNFALGARSFFQGYAVAGTIGEAGFDLFYSQRFDAEICQTQRVIQISRVLGGRIWSEAHEDVDVFENLTRSDAEDSVAGFDEIVALASAVLAAEVVGEAEAGIKLFCFYQETRAVGFPLNGFHRGGDPDAR